jgi:hypothetical protein
MARRNRTPSLYRRAPWALSCVGALLAWSSPAAATFSILAVDTRTGVIGATAASCVGTKISLSEIITIDPLVGGVIAQGLLFPEGRERIFEALQAGSSPIDSLKAALDPTFDPSTDNSGPEHRQYAALTIQGEAAVFTGSDSLAFAGDRTGQSDTFVYSIQGNVLDGSGVLDALEEGFIASEGGLGVRLVAALDAVATAGQGDSRCSPLTADAAYFELRVPGQQPFEWEVVTPGSDATAKLVAEAAPLLPPEPEGTLEDEHLHDAGSSRNVHDSVSGCQLTPGNSGGGVVWLLASFSVAFRRLSPRPSRALRTKH